MQRLDFPSSIETIKPRAFFACYSLYTLVFNAASPREIGESAFSCAESLGKISLPEGLEHIGEFEFFNCLPLVEIAIPEGVKPLSYALNSCESLTKVLLPNSPTTIGKEAFRDCKSLKTVYFPTSKGPKKIVPNAFKGCSPDLTLCGTGGSVAEKFAAKKEIRFESR